MSRFLTEIVCRQSQTENTSRSTWSVQLFSPQRVYLFRTLDQLKRNMFRKVFKMLSQQEVIQFLLNEPGITNLMINISTNTERLKKKFHQEQLGKKLFKNCYKATFVT